MKSYIAYGANGKNKIFETQLALKVHFELTHSIQVENLVERGLPITDPDTQEVYYIDEIDNDLGAKKP